MNARPLSRPRRARRVPGLQAAALIAVLSVTACAPDIVFVSDEYLDELVLDSGFESGVEEIERDIERRIAVAVVTAESDYRPDATAGCYLFSPLLRDIGIEYAGGTGALVYVMGQVEAEVPENVIPVVFERNAAFGLAGEAAARLSRESEEGPTLVGALVLTDDPTSREEIASFSDAFRVAAPGADIRTRSYVRQPRREELRSDVRDMLTRGVKVLLIALGDQNAFALDILSGQDVKVITEDAAATGGFEDKIVYSVERSLLSALESAARSCVEDGGRPLVVPAELVRVSTNVAKKD